MKFRYFLTVIIALAGFMASAHDFSASIKGQVLYFNVIDKVKRNVEVTFHGSASDSHNCENKGVIEIPGSVKQGNETFVVVSIGPKAFANGKGITEVILPSTVNDIRDFAFEGCTGLESIIFPGVPVKMGQGVFFNCTSISSITFGSDWEYIDFSAFRWSDRLTSVRIPAKTNKVQGLKKLKYLEEITVDPNNKTFSSAEGLLYSKGYGTLYCCPRSYKGRVEISEGNETVIPGALIDCPFISAIVLPTTLKSVSFRETSRMAELETIVMKGDSPTITGYSKGKGYFFFQLLAPKTEIIVPYGVKTKYIDDLPTEIGEYSETPDGILYMVNVGEIPTKKDIKGVKNFDKF